MLLSASCEDGGGGAAKSWKSGEPLEGPALPTLGFSLLRSKLDSRPAGLSGDTFMLSLCYFVIAAKGS